MNPMKVQNDTVEYYMYLIVIKLAVLIALYTLKTIHKIHAGYKKNLKKKYAAKDIEAAKPTASNSK